MYESHGKRLLHSSRYDDLRYSEKCPVLLILTMMRAVADIYSYNNLARKVHFIATRYCVLSDGKCSGEFSAWVRICSSFHHSADELTARSSSRPERQQSRPERQQSRHEWQQTST